MNGPPQGCWRRVKNDACGTEFVATGHEVGIETGLTLRCLPLGR